jgi:hypothetical protein
LKKSGHASLCASSARLVAVVSLGSSATMIGFTYSQSAASEVILAYAEIKLIVTKRIQMGRDFRELFGPNLSGLEARQAGLFGPYST